jgi:hypothetical protein
VLVSSRNLEQLTHLQTCCLACAVSGRQWISSHESKNQNAAHLQSLLLFIAPALVAERTEIHRRVFADLCSMTSVFADGLLYRRHSRCNMRGRRSASASS